MKELPLIEKMLKEIFDELEKDAYDVDFHGYHYKQANQIIRKYFEILIKPMDNSINKQKGATNYQRRIF